ncbi:MAG: hypothetical protein ACREIC_29360 [Limisphaerales bacterium]
MVTMEANGVGYIIPTLNPDPSLSEMLGDLNKSIDIYNGPASSGTLLHGGTSGNGVFTQFTGTGTPSSLSHATSLSKTPDVTGGDINKGIPLTIDLGNYKYDYLIVRWDGKNGSDSIYYIGNLTGTITIFDEPTSINAKQDPGSYNASSYWLADPTQVPSPSVVPEPATIFAASLLLLPLGASMLRILRRSRLT